MRDIKFRVWDKKGKKMRQLVNMIFNTGFNLEPNDNTLKLIWVKGYDIIEQKNIQIQREKDFELMQYTGLHDKNGKEIYEGDIVTGKDYPFIDEEKQNYIGIVVFYEDVAQFGYEYKCVRKDKRGISNGINNEFLANKDLICEELEVIGNVWENKDLLEEV